MREQAPKNSTGRGRYSKIIREQGEGLLALESVANRLLAEKDAEIARLRRALEIIDPETSPVPRPTREAPHEQ